MAVIDGVLCLDARVICNRKTLSVVTLEWSKTRDTYNTPDTVARYRKHEIMSYEVFRSSSTLSTSIADLAFLRQKQRNRESDEP